MTVKFCLQTNSCLYYSCYQERSSQSWNTSSRYKRIIQEHWNTSQDCYRSIRRAGTHRTDSDCPKKAGHRFSTYSALQPRKWNTADIPVPYKHDLKILLPYYQRSCSKDNIVSTAEIIIDYDIRISAISYRWAVKTYRFYTFCGRLHVKNTITERRKVSLQLREKSWSDICQKPEGWIFDRKPADYNTERKWVFFSLRSFLN